MLKGKEIIAVIGAGVMGQGVSFQLAKFDYGVILVDINEETLSKASENVRYIEQFDILMQKNINKVTNARRDLYMNIRYTVHIEEAAEASVIIENIPEKMEIKRMLYSHLRKIVGNETMVAVNTSATPITGISSLLKDPSNVIGIHFVNPVHLMPTVEMVKGAYTSDFTIQKARKFLATMGMKGVLVNDAPGFVSNRVMLSYINEAIFCVEEKVGTPKDVDQIFRECLSHKMGPLETADLIGLDTILFSLEVLQDEFRDMKYRAAGLLTEMVKEGRLGRKSGTGFYNYH